MSDFSDDEEFFESIRRHEKEKQTQKVTNTVNQEIVTDDLSLVSLSNGLGAGIPAAVGPETQELSHEIKQRLYQADGEIAILKSQLEHAKSKEFLETRKLKDTFQESKTSMEEQINQLKFTVQRLEDEKKFLDNQVRTGYSKKRKTDSGGSFVRTETKVSRPPSRDESKQRQKVIRVQSDTTSLTEYLWRLSINGSKHTTMDYLGRICLRTPVTISGFTFAAKLPISGIILEYLINKKDLRLDKLIQEFFKLLENLVERLVSDKVLTCVPFILCLIHGVLGFKPSGISAIALQDLTEFITRIINEFKTNLDEEDKELFNYNKTPQHMILEKFILIISMDIIESIMMLCNLHLQSQLGIQLFYDHGIKDLLSQFIPRNQEALVSIAQINIIYNIVEIFNNYYEVNEQEEMTPETIQTFLHLYLLGIPIKEDFKFQGLNRCIGNNDDYGKIDKSVYNDEYSEIRDTNLIVVPNPIPKLPQRNHHAIEFDHEYHVLQLQIRISEMIEAYLVNKVDVKIIKSIDTVNLIVRIMSFEQQHITRSPRSKFTNFRTKLISNYTRILNHLFKFCKQLNEIINIEALNHLTIVLSRIAFSTDLSSASIKLYKDLRTKNYKLPIMNSVSEEKARLAHNITIDHVDKQYISEIESYSVNGLEVAYDSDTIEFSREILGLCIDNEVADNLYININGYQSLHSEMDIDM